MKKFQELVVWQKAHQLVLDIYRITDRFPSEERFGLVAQMRRSAISVPSNIAEGHSRSSKRAFAQFISIAQGSLEELRYFIDLSRDLGYLMQEHAEMLLELNDEVGKMLGGLSRHVKEEIKDAQSASI